MRHLLLLAMVSLLVACAATPRERVANGYVIVQTLAEATQMAYDDGHIDDETKAEIKVDLRTSLEYLEQAEKGDPGLYLNAVSQLLLKVEEKLNDRN